MKRCCVKPYVGCEKYIFISYSHKDIATVFPVIEQLSKDGYRVWFDDGIDPGSEWPESIASKINNCSVFLSFISENSLGSHNCCREINFALLKKKPFLSVFIEPVYLSPGMEMQFSDVQAVYKYKYNDINEFFTRMYSATVLSPCLGLANPSVNVSKPEEHTVNLMDLYGIDNRRRVSINDKWFIDDNKNNEFISSLKTRNSEKNHVFLQSYKTNQKLELYLPETKFGRNNSLIDYSINNSAVSRIHAKILYKNNNYYLQDCFAKNKTFLNFNELQPECEYLLSEGDLIKFANERFIFHRVEG